MSNIDYIDLFKKIQDMGYESVRLSCCDLNYDTFRLMRVQMQGDIYYTRSI